MNEMPSNSEIENILDIFNSQIKDVVPIFNGCDAKHDGKLGHWLEQQFGIERNCKIAPDLNGYEIKTCSGSAISFGS